MNLRPPEAKKLQSDGRVRSARRSADRLGRILLVSVLAALVCLVLVGTGLRVIGYRMVIVSSGSMEPSLERGDLVVVNTRNDPPEVGDILTFIDSEGDLVTHRVIDLDDGTITTMGDANERSDTPIMDASDIVGTTSRVLPGIGRPFLSDVFKRTIIGGMLLALASAVLLRASPSRRPQGQTDKAAPSGLAPSHIRVGQARRRPALFVVERVPLGASSVEPGDSTQPR